MFDAFLTWEWVRVSLGQSLLSQIFDTFSSVQFLFNPLFCIQKNTSLYQMKKSIFVSVRNRIKMMMEWEKRRQREKKKRRTHLGRNSDSKGYNKFPCFEQSKCRFFIPTGASFLVGFLWNIFDTNRVGINWETIKKKGERERKSSFDKNVIVWHGFCN